MRNTIVILFFAVLLAAPAGALEIESAVRLGNMYFPEKILADNNFPADTYRLGISAKARQDMSSGIAIDFGYELDPILKNYIHSGFSYSRDFFTIGAGPVLGVFNTSGLGIRPGIKTDFRLEWPGIIFVRFGILSSVGTGLLNAGDYSQNYGSVSLGFYLYNVVCSLNMTQKEFLEVTKNSQDIMTKTLEYSFVTDIHQKNTPYRIKIGIIYRQAQKLFSSQVVSGTDIKTRTNTQRLNTLILQTRGDFDIGSNFTLFADLQSNLFHFGNIEDPDGNKTTLKFSRSFPGNYLFEASLGCTVRFAGNTDK